MTTTVQALEAEEVAKLAEAIEKLWEKLPMQRRHEFLFRELGGQLRRLAEELANPRGEGPFDFNAEAAVLLRVRMSNAMREAFGEAIRLDGTGSGDGSGNAWEMTYVISDAEKATAAVAWLRRHGAQMKPQAEINTEREAALARQRAKSEAFWENRSLGIASAAKRPTEGT